MLRDQVADDGDFFGVVGAGLDDDVVDLGGDFVAVLGGEEHGEIKLANHFHGRGAGAEIVGEDEAAEGLGGVGLCGGGGGQHDVFAVAGRDDEGAAPEVLGHVVGGHGCDNDVLDELG